MFELRIVPKDTAGLDEMFRVLCECAAMNPDDDDDDDDDDGGFFYDEDEVMRGAGAEEARGAGPVRRDAADRSGRGRSDQGRSRALRGR